MLTNKQLNKLFIQTSQIVDKDKYKVTYTLVS